MPCDTQPAKNQTLAERKTEVRETIARLSKLLTSRQVRAVVGPQGAITFQDWSAQDRARVTDACAYRLLMVSGSSLAKAEIARAEQLAGRSVDKKVVASGVHGHSNGQGGVSWHPGHK